MAEKIRNKSAVNMTPAKRVVEFGSEKFSVEGNLLWCKVCDFAVDHVRKQTIVDHMKSQKHCERAKKRQTAENQGAPAPKRQATIEAMQKRTIAASTYNEKVVLDIVEAFMSANIPLEKLDNPKMREFINRYVKAGTAIPKANQIREKYVPKFFSNQQALIVQNLAGHKVVAIVDETTDVTGRYVVNVLLQPLDAFAPTFRKALLVNTEFLTEVNNATIAQVIVRTLTLANINFNDVMALISDNATYMKKCFRDGLSGILPNAVHVTCWAHIISLTGDEFRAALKECDVLVATVKAIFSKAPGRRARYLNHLRRNNITKVTMPPVPVVTRWNTWFAAALYHANHLDLYISFVDAEIENTGTTLQLSKLQKCLRGVKLDNLRVELEFLAVHCERLMKTLTSLEEHKFKSVDIYNKVVDLLSWLRAPGFPYATSNCADCMNNASAKLGDYVEGTKQPALKLFKAVRIFDPKQLPLLSKTFTDYTPHIPKMAAAAGEWQMYLDIAAREEITDDITEFWKALEERLPRLSALEKTYIALPVTPVDVERSFSKYGSILSPLRCCLSTDSLRSYCSVFYNNSVL